MRTLIIGACLIVLRVGELSAADGHWQKIATGDCLVWIDPPRPSQSVSWSGVCAAGKAAGTGLRIVTYDKKGVRVSERYEGEMAGGKRYGHGTVTFANNERYIGAWRADKRSGHGTWYEADGSRLYEGAFLDGKWHGRGTVHFGNGQPFYRGQFRAGQFDGPGTITYANGARYSGQWRAGMRHGRGRRTRANGDRYDGPFVDNQAHGSGTCFVKATGREAACEMRFSKFIRWLE